MSLKKLNKKSREFNLPQEKIAEFEKGRLSFISEFPLDKIKDLSIDQYVQGTDDNSFCYWLEFKKIGFGIGGGNASKFGIYKTKNNNEIVYAIGYGKNKQFLYADDAVKHYKSILDKILIALDYTKNNEIEKIKELDIPMWNMVLQKILSIYYPDKFLTIGSPDVIIKCAKELQLDKIDLSPANSIQINYECKKALSNLPEYRSWSYEKIGTFIWENFHEEKRKRSENKLYWLYSPGENAKNWDEFHEKGIMGLGWDEIGDLSQYHSRNEIKKALVDAHGGTGSKKNDVSANDDFLNKLKIGDVVIAKKGKNELLGYGIVTSDYIFDENRTEYQKVRKVDWKLKGNWQVDFNLVLKTLTDITKYKSDHPDNKNYYERLLGIMDQGKPEKDYKEEFTKWLTNKYGANSGTTSSYLKAIDILSQILSKELLKTTDNKYLETLYDDLVNEQRNPDGKFYHQDAPSYGNNGFYSASINSYREFLKTIKKTSDQMNFPLNTILYGPPGTGKTYNTILRAAEIIEGRKIASYDEALDIFKANLHDRIEFITFHQNYSYEDFIQGLRPETDNKSSLVFDKKDGVFKKIADKALDNIKLSEKAPSELSNEAQFNFALDKFQDVVLESEDNFAINDTAYIFEVEEDAFRYTGEKWTNHVNGLRMKFNDLKEFYRHNVKSRKDIKELTSISGLAKQHATYYFLVYDQIIKYLPNNNIPIEVGNSIRLNSVLRLLNISTKRAVEFLKSKNIHIEKIPYIKISKEAYDLLFKEFYLGPIIKVEKLNYVIIIDEINRANISRVFGELITLIEPDKRSHGAIPLEARLPSGDPFIVPSNLHIIGTMNTADKSIALLDIALRRRFEFESMYPKYEIKDQEIYDVAILKKINEQIIKSKGHDFQIGHAYFMGDNKDLVERMNKKVIPLLLEYYMNDKEEVKAILNSADLKIEDNSWPLRIIGKND